MACKCSSRRSFLKMSGVTLFVSAVSPKLISAAGDPRLERYRGIRPKASHKTLINVWFRGGQDGLNVVVPYGDPDYYVARPNIAVQPPAVGDAESAIDLDHDGVVASRDPDGKALPGPGDEWLYNSPGDLDDPSWELAPLRQLRLSLLGRTRSPTRGRRDPGPLVLENRDAASASGSPEALYTRYRLTTLVVDLRNL